jgi:hypothetical protein
MTGFSCPSPLAGPLVAEAAPPSPCRPPLDRRRPRTPFSLTGTIPPQQFKILTLTLPPLSLLIYRPVTVPPPIFTTTYRPVTRATPDLHHHLPPSQCSTTAAAATNTATAAVGPTHGRGRPGQCTGSRVPMGPVMTDSFCFD